MKSDFSVQKIYNHKECYEWLLKKHYAHRIPPISHAFGLYEKGVLKGVCTFGIPANQFLCTGVAGEIWKSCVLELNRLVVDSDEQNITSWFVSRCFKTLIKPTFVVSYADTGQGHIGKIYQACNFLFTGTTKERTDPDLEGKHQRHIKTDGSVTKRRVRTAKHRYIMILGNKRVVKKMLSDLRYPILPYPKGDTHRYDASYNPISQMIMF